MKLDELAVSDRIELHPATDLWMQGARYGKVIGFERGFVLVELDKRPGTTHVQPRNILRKV